MIMERKRLAGIATTLVTILLAGSPNAVLACGESLFHVGKGVTFRTYAAPLPGKILVVARTEGELMMVERLAAAGHDVHVIDDESQIGTELASVDFDVVMTLFKDRQLVEAQMRSVASNASYLPVAQAGTLEEQDVRAVGPNPLSTDDSVKQFLKAIHRTLKSRRS